MGAQSCPEGCEALSCQSASASEGDWEGGNPEPLSHIPVPKLGKRNQCSPTLPISSRLQTTQPATLSFSLVFLPGPGAHGRYTASPEKNGT